MKFPSSLLLNFDNYKNNQPRTYWMLRCLVQHKITASFASKFLWHQDRTIKKNIFSKPYKFTLTYSNARFLKKLSEIQKNFYIKTQAPNPKLKKKLLHSDHIESQIYDYLVYTDMKVNYKKFLREIVRLRRKIKFTKRINNIVTTKFNIIFFKKERVYTKLKYSRVPQYDAVSGGAAALLSGFLGFLITEKFGLELTDSGDFWFVFLYCSFSLFFCQPLLKMIMEEKEDTSVFSYQWGFDFYFTIGTCFINFCKTFYENIKMFLYR